MIKDKRLMSKRAIIVEFIVRSLTWAIALGAVVGFLFNLTFLGPVTYGLFGLGLGIAAGSILGIVNGVVLAIITLRFPNVLDNVDKYKNTVGVVSGVLTLIGSGLAFFAMIYFLFRVATFAACISIPASIFAAFAAFYASQKVSAWYVDLSSALNTLHTMDD
jgi:hypothetical protein